MPGTQDALHKYDMNNAVSSFANAREETSVSCLWIVDPACTTQKLLLANQKPLLVNLDKPGKEHRDLKVWKPVSESGRLLATLTAAGSLLICLPGNPGFCQADT